LQTTLGTRTLRAASEPRTIDRRKEGSAVREIHVAACPPVDRFAAPALGSSLEVVFAR
jgi:hypothetical protein